MDTLKELTYIVTKNKLKAIELLDTNAKNKSRTLRFYEAISEGQFTTDEEAAAFFFPDTDDSAQYRKLKSRLRKRLINSLFFIDVKQPAYNDRQRAYYECHKEWAAAKILLGKNAWSSCVDISERILKYAVKYEFTEMTLDILRILWLNYGARVGNVKKFEEYKAQHEIYEQVFIAENKAELLYTELIVHYVNSKSTKENMQEIAVDFFERLKPSLDQFDSYRLHLYGGMIELMIHTIINDYKSTLVTCERIIHFFESKPYSANTPLQAAYYQKLVCHSQLGQFEEGKLAAKKCLDFIEEGSVNWFKYYELYFMLTTHTEQYKAAYQVYQKVTSHKRFSFLHDNVKEIWVIFEAYLHYLYDLDVLKLEDSESHFSKFKLGRFVNDTPIFSKDKRGMNIAILIIQILVLIAQKKYNEAIDRMEAIEKYCNRYLQKPHTIRSYYFIKMVLTIPAASFHKKAVVRRAEPFLKKLTQLPIEVANQTHKIEILPYELLWQLALNTLEEKTYMRNRKRKSKTKEEIIE
ncbi:MAG TPA: hypothetical protein PKA00_10890 [Saprospiraceae bacterium]|nr:hypothetical protein [Saprospiraceae bacterium]HMQ83408.1 hypothetical protein [Saprospiraceae bacterium]